ncbi:MAG TPA: fatty acid desaturase [Steroidobacteraceae bacterium]|nr:fatty acid desaturase [Steroidobacteraceae bacterium]
MSAAVPEHEEGIDDPFAVWFAPQVNQDLIRRLMRRTNLRALATVGVWLLLCVLTGALVVLSVHTLWVIPAMLLYGAILGFSYAASHECAHGTAFRARWLNETVFWLTSLVFMEEPLYRRYAHAAHHTHTWFNPSDPQKPYGNPMSLSRYANATLGVTFYFDAVRQLARHSAGRFTAEEREFIPDTERPRASLNSRAMLGVYFGLVAYGIAFQSPWPFVLYFIPRLLGGPIVTAYINTQHMCMAEDVYDHRRTTRSIRCNAVERLLYWNMNFHIEHHLFPAIPFHALPALNAEIATQLPAANRGVIGTNIDIVRAIVRQRTDPSFNLSPVH